MYNRRTRCYSEPSSFFFFNDTATTEIYTLSLHDALPISNDHPARASLADLGAARARLDIMCVSRKDRKSTRLNSSHSQISYAVFCLKKKIESYADTGDYASHSEQMVVSEIFNRCHCDVSI